MSNQQDRIIALAIERVPPKVIAHQLRLDRDDVYAAIRRARKNGTDIPVFRSAHTPLPDHVPETPQLAIPSRLHSLLVSEAERRGFTPCELALNLLEKGLLEGWSRRARN